MWVFGCRGGCVVTEAGGAQRVANLAPLSSVSVAGAVHRHSRRSEGSGSIAAAWVFVCRGGRRSAARRS